MPYYETVFIARQDLTEAQVKTLTEGFSKVITDMGGQIHKVEQWGLKTFAYKINKSRKGHYTLIESDAPAAALIELERLMRLNEDVVRSLTIKLDELSTGPSVMMRPQHDRDSQDDSRNDKEAA
ncbi:MAG: 30S ribosomal protein S6 [Alphaproteobacteria bacterium]|nr:30S ribosomal protein S6 [Alphaproteobacteria bacterium]